MINETEAADRINGKNSAERKKARSHAGIFDCTSSASSRAIASCTITAAMTKPMVLRNDVRTVGFEKSAMKFPTPTNFGAVMTSQWKNASTNDAMIGRKLNSPSATTVGRRKTQMSLEFFRDSGSTSEALATALVVGSVDISVPSVRAQGHAAWSPVRDGRRPGRW